MPRGRFSIAPTASLLAALSIGLVPGLQNSARAQLGDDDPPAAGAPGAPAAPQAPSYTGGEIKFESQDHDFADVLQTDRPEGDFHFVNEGSTELEIFRVTPTCGCTVAELTKKRYAPGERGSIHIKFDASGKSGEVLKHVTVVCSDPKRPEVQLNFKARVEPTVMVEPLLINFGQVGKEEVKKVTVTVTGRTDDFDIGEVTVRRNEILSVRRVEEKAAVVEVNGKKLRRATLELTLKAGANVGNLDDSLSVRTNDSREPLVNTRVAAVILGDIQATPSTMAFGLVQTGADFAGEVRVKNRQGKAFKIEKVDEKFNNVVARQPNRVDLQFTFEPTDSAGTEWVIRASGKAPEKVVYGVQTVGTIVVHTDIPGEQFAEVPYALQFRMGKPLPQKAAATK